MREKVRLDALRAVIGMLLVLLLFELLYSVLLDQWLDRWLVFRLHVPTAVFSAVALLMVAVNFYEYHGFGSQEGIVRHGPGKPYVALTFDDGPNPKYTPKILDILKENKAPATFFMVGRHVLKYPEIAKRVFAEGHEIGNHTFSHRELLTASKKTALKEAEETNEAIKSVVGIETKLFRPPRGLISKMIQQMLAARGFTIVLWTVSAQDWRRDAPKVMVKRIIRHVRPGGIVLFHDSGALLRAEGGSRVGTVEALPMVIEALHARGYEIVSLSRLISDLGQVPADNVVEVLAPTSVGQEI